MKKQSNNLLVIISKDQVDNLTNVVNETLASGFNHSNHKVFTAADFWNIQRQGKSTINKRHFL